MTQRELKTPLETVQQQAAQAAPVRDFVGSLLEKINNKQSAVIAEIKKASPSKGVIRENFDPQAIAKSYQQGGATCLSVLTDEDYFQGSDQYLIDARNACDLPVLRKDFIVKPYQIYESRALGADCILLIVASLNEQQLIEFNDIAKQLGLAVLIEVHNQDELNTALKIDSPLVGINNRDLHNFKTTLQTTLTLSKQIPDNKIIISESGIYTQEDIQSLKNAGIHGFLIGESLMRAKDPGTALAYLINPEI